MYKKKKKEQELDDVKRTNQSLKNAEFEKVIVNNKKNYMKKSKKMK